MSRVNVCTTPCKPVQMHGFSMVKYFSCNLKKMKDQHFARALHSQFTGVARANQKTEKCHKSLIYYILYYFCAHACTLCTPYMYKQLEEAIKNGKIGGIVHSAYIRVCVMCMTTERVR